jgi:superfamily II DNA or RNA helicase
MNPDVFDHPLQNLKNIGPGKEFEVRFKLQTGTELEVFHRVLDSFGTQGYTKVLSNTIDFSLGNIRKTIDTNTGSVIYIRKIKEAPIDLQEYNLRFSLATETVLEDPGDFDESLAFKREKNRVSFELPIGSLDLTEVKQQSTSGGGTQYEIELEINKDDITLAKESLVNVLRIIQDNNVLLSNSQRTLVLNEYKKLVNVKYPIFIGTQPVTLHKKDILELYKNKYSVTDKADGDRFLLFVTQDSKIYLLNNNVTKILGTDLTLETTGALGSTLIDGELVQVGSKKVFLAFDLVVYNGVDLRKSTDNLSFRLQKLKSVLKSIKSSDNYSIELKTFYTESIISNSLKIMQNAASYKYGNDGLIFTPIDQNYSSNPLKIYKWKPAELNTIDFFSIQKEGDTGDLWELYVKDDNGTVLFDCNKLCGNSGDCGDSITHQTHFDNTLGYKSNTVIEYKWDFLLGKFTPIRTRWDKTANPKKHGNFKSIACDIWKNIHNPVKLEDLFIPFDPISQTDISAKPNLIKKYDLVCKNYTEYKTKFSQDNTIDPTTGKKAHVQVQEILAKVFQKDNFCKEWTSSTQKEITDSSQEIIEPTELSKESTESSQETPKEPSESTESPKETSGFIDPITQTDISAKPNLIKKYDLVCKDYTGYKTKFVLNNTIDPTTDNPVHPKVKEILTQVFKKDNFCKEWIRKVPSVTKQITFCEQWGNSVTIDPLTGENIVSNAQLIKMYNDICKNFDEYNNLNSEELTQKAMELYSKNPDLLDIFLRIFKSKGTNDFCEKWSNAVLLNPLDGKNMIHKPNQINLYNDVCKDYDKLSTLYIKDPTKNPINNKDIGVLADLFSKIFKDVDTSTGTDTDTTLSNECTTYSSTVLRDHQLYVANYILNFDVTRMLLFHSIGSGKTLTAITLMRCIAHKNPGIMFFIVTPKSLQENFKKEMAKVQVTVPNVHFYTHQKFTNLIQSETAEFTRNSCIIIDEAHNFNTHMYNVGDVKIEMKTKYDGGKYYTMKKKVKVTIPTGVGPRRLFRATNIAKYVFMLTATPVSNTADEFGNIHTILTNKEQVYSEVYLKYANKTVNISELKNKISYYNNIDVSDYPDRIDKKIILHMDPEYYRLYTSVEKGNTGGLKGTIFEHSQDLIQYYNGIRQAVNIIDENTPSQKIRWIKNEICKRVQNKEKVLIYSNWIRSGIVLIRKILKNLGIPYVEIIGSSSMEERRTAVESFNKNKVLVIIISAAGGEGIDLKGTRAVIITEPHWHSEKLRQITGRAIRYKSHSHLPPDQRNVTVYHLLLAKPKMTDDFGVSVHRMKSIDLKLDEMMNSKDLHINEFYQQLQKVSIEYTRAPFVQQHIQDSITETIVYKEEDDYDYCASLEESLGIEESLEESQEESQDTQGFIEESEEFSQEPIDTQEFIEESEESTNESDLDKLFKSLGETSGNPGVKNDFFFLK